MKKILGILVITFLICANIFAQNQVLRLDGDGDSAIYVNNLVGGRTDFTICVWVKPPSSYSGWDSCIISEWYTGSYPSENNFGVFFDLESLGASTYNPGFLIGQSSTTYTVESNTEISADNWHHIAVVKEADEIRIIVNEIMTTSSCEIGAINNNTNYSFQIAKFGSSHYTELSIDEVRIWDYALTQEQIQNNMHGDLTGNEIGLVGYWNFDDGTLNDLTTNGNNGAFQGDAITIQENIPEFFNAYFQTTETNSYIGEEIQFTDFSVPQDSIISWEWDFENDGIFDAFVQNPTHTYNTEGVYSVKLKIGNGTLVDSLIKENLVDVTYCPPASPQNVNVEIVQPNAIISWAEVDTTNCGSAITPDGYVVKYSENEEDYFYLWFTTETNFTHSFVTEYSPQMFYEVIAIKNYSREQIDYLESLNNSREKLKWSEVKRNLEKLK